MKRTSKNGLVALQFENPIFSNCVHGIFTRHGGVSKDPWRSLNQGGTVGDDRDCVVENRKRAFDLFDREFESIFDVWQVHGSNIVCTDRPRELTEPHIKADAIFTNNPEITLFMRFADCVPIMMFDPVLKVVGIIHAGWKGTVNNIIGEAVKTITEVYGVNAKNIHAGIGPSIGMDHYDIGPEVEEQVVTAFGKDNRNLLHVRNGKTYFDLWRANEFWLKEQGIESIETAKICTACHIEDWYSHRAENGTTGRFGALIALTE